MPFWSLCVENEAIFVEEISSRLPGWGVHIERITSLLPRSPSQKLRSRLLDQPGLSCEHIKIFTIKEKVSGRDFGTWLSPVDRLLWGGPNSMSMRKLIKTIVVKSPILLNLGINSYLGKWIIVAKKYVKVFHSSQVRATPCRSRNLTLIYAHLTIQLCFSISTTRKALWNRYPLVRYMNWKNCAFNQKNHSEFSF